MYDVRGCTDVRTAIPPYCRTPVHRTFITPTTTIINSPAMPSPPEIPGLSRHPVLRWTGGSHDAATDELAVEEPLEVLLATGVAGHRNRRPLAVTMRTPGQDVELVLGFLFTEGLIARAAQVQGWRQLDENRLLVELAPEVRVDVQRLERNFYTTSSCGVCGKASLEAVQTVSCYFPRPGQPRVSASMLLRLPEALRRQQTLFRLTGGIHAAALFTAQGELLLLREDVGRHNALDKLIGAALLQGLVPMTDHLLLVSGRAGFELVQKAAMAGLPVLAAVGAPSSLAVELAGQAGMTLVGFLRSERFNIYIGAERIMREEV